MAYEKFHDEWLDLPSLITPITAEALNHIEDGIAAAAVADFDENEIFVSTKTGASDSNSGLSRSDPLATIEAARDLMADEPGASIILGSGDHSATPDGDMVLTAVGQSIIAGGPGRTRVLMTGDGTWGAKAQHSLCTLEGFQLVTSGEVQYGVGISTPGPTGTASGGEIRRVWVIPGAAMEGAFCLGPDHAGSSAVDLAGTLLEHLTFFPNDAGVPAFGRLENGYLIGNGTAGNVLQNYAHNCQGAGADYAVTLAGAGVQWFGGGFGYSQIADIYITHGGGDIIAFYGMRSEVGAMVLKRGYTGTGYSIPHLNDYQAIDYDPPDGETIIDSAGSLLLTGGSYRVIGGNAKVVIDGFGGGGRVFEAHGVSFDSADPYRGIPASVVQITSGTRMDVAGEPTANPGADAAGAWQNYTPTISGTGWALGDGTVIGRWAAAAGIVHVEVTITFGASSTYGSAALEVSWPTAALPAETIGLSSVRAVALDQGNNFFTLNGFPALTKVILYGVGTSGEWGTDVISSYPFTWATGDTLCISATYEAA